MIKSSALGAKMNTAYSTSLAVILACFSMGSGANVVTFDESGLAAPGPQFTNQVQNYYDGGYAKNGAIGPGPSYGISFDNNSYAYAPTNTQVGYDGSPGVLTIFNSTQGINFFDSLVSVSSGFTSFSFDWSSRQEFSISLLDASGTALASGAFNVNNNYYGPWATNVNIALAGATAYSVDIYAVSNTVFLDNLNFGQPSGQIPEPGSIALVGLALAGVWASKRRSRRPN